MNRSRRFVAGTIMGYALIAANLLYTLLSVPLALRYLGKEGFGVWALALQITGYLTLLDFGVSIAVSRFLAETKDDPAKPDYAKTFVVGCIVLVTQGLLIVLVGSSFALLAPQLFGIPVAFSMEFRNLLVILAFVSGVNMAMRAFWTPLWGFQRLDIVYSLHIYSLLSSLPFLWVGFMAGWGIYSLALASVPALLTTPVFVFFYCRHKKYYPAQLKITHFDWSMFRRVFFFGKDAMLISLGSQLVNASQIIILSKWVSLEAAASFAIGTKFFTMGQQFSGRIMDSASPGLTELYVRNQRQRFQERYGEIFVLTGFLSTLLGIGLVCGNTLIVSIWTSGKITWNPRLDLLLALLLILTSGTRCTMSIFNIVAFLRPVRHAYFWEACVFLILAIPASGHFGIAGVLMAALIAHLAVTTLLVVSAAKPYLNGDGGFKRAVFRGVSVVCATFLIIFVWPEVTSPTIQNILLLSAIFFAFSMATWGWVLTKGTRSRLITLAMKFIPS